ncbi:hypothetical protein [Maricaulis sp.]|uniref:hypothetical protein n=1 Tax=Maricaulis sp. TaxID=1486257 RepID=UPI003A8F1365
MFQSDLTAGSTCPSARFAGETAALLIALAEAEEAGGFGDPAAQAITKRLKAVEEAASWVRPRSAEGAFLHLLMASADAMDLPRASPACADAMEMRCERNLYAVRSFLLQAIEDPAGSVWSPLLANYMTDGMDQVRGLERLVNPLAGMAPAPEHGG